MSTLTMNMSGYEIERNDAASSGYDDEVLCAGWVPALEMHRIEAEHAGMPAEMALMDVETFLRKMYLLQR
ncbi:MAG: hypothetical protein U1C96_05195 [Gallionella sp.]|nr:hypothetical protein [Gallionella sp.]